jgi:hypothetical protein
VLEKIGCRKVGTIELELEERRVNGQKNAKKNGSG